MVNCGGSVSSFPVWSTLKLKPELATVGQLDWSLTRSHPFVRTVRLCWWIWEKLGEDFLEWREKLPERWRPSFFICSLSTVIRRSYSEESVGQVRHNVNPSKLIRSSWMCRHKERVSEWKRHTDKVMRNKVRSCDLPSIQFPQVKISICCLMPLKRNVLECYIDAV